MVYSNIPVDCIANQGQDVRGSDGWMYQCSATGGMQDVVHYTGPYQKVVYSVERKQQKQEFAGYVVEQNEWVTDVPPPPPTKEVKKLAKVQRGKTSEKIEKDIWKYVAPK